MPDSGAQISVVLVDSRRLMREGLRAVLSAERGLDVTGVGSLEDVSATPGAVVVVAQSPQGTSMPAGLVVVSDHSDVASLVAAIRAHARGGDVPPVRKPARAVAVGPAGPTTSQLSARERTVLRGVRTGSSAAEIGRQLGISQRTVEAHKRSVIAKLGVTNHASAVAVATERPLLIDAG